MRDCISETSILSTRPLQTRHPGVRDGEKSSMCSDGNAGLCPAGQRTKDGGTPRPKYIS